MSPTITLGQLSRRLECALVGGDPSTPIRGVSTLERAGEGEVTFLANLKYAPKVKASRAAAIIAGEPLKDIDPQRSYRTILIMISRELSDSSIIRRSRSRVSIQQLPSTPPRESVTVRPLEPMLSWDRIPRSGRTQLFILMWSFTRAAA